jgi:hypothetical protein
MWKLGEARTSGGVERRARVEKISFIFIVQKSV